MPGSHTVKPNLLTAQVIEQLEEPIVGGGLEPGSSLPSEVELVERSGVRRVGHPGGRSDFGD